MMELGTIEEVELIVDQIAGNKIPPPNKAQSLVIIRQMVRMAKQVEAQAKEIADLREQVFWLKAARPNIAVVAENERLKALCDQMGEALEYVDKHWHSGMLGLHEDAIAAWREMK